MTNDADERAVVFSVGESDDVMVRWPNGRVQFLTTWQAIKLAFALTWKRRRVTLAEDK